MPSENTAGSARNPFLEPSTLPYELPPFDQIDDSHYLPAFEQGMAEQLAEVEAISSDPEPPTFENTLEALERSGQLLGRVSLVFFGRASAHTNPAISEVETEIAPRLAAHRDQIYLDRRLFERISALYANRDGLDAESSWLVERYHTDFVRAGAQLDDAGQQRLRELNEELSALSTKFKENLLADTNASAVVVDDAAELDGMPDDSIAAAAEAAKDRGLDGKYVLSLILPTAQPPLAFLTNRDVRQRIFEASVARGGRGNEFDTREVITKAVAARAERARLLGYTDHASYVIEDKTARTVDAANDMLARLAPAAVANAKAEADALNEVAGRAVELAPWDWAFYSEQVRRDRYELDESALRPYFELDKVIKDGVFFAAGQLYGLTFTERHDLPTYHPDIRVFEVFNADGQQLGLFLGDYYARESKRGGAWMNSSVRQSRLLGQPPVVHNTLNITKPPPGEPTLLTFDEVRTLFHEFGHALHGLFSDVRYPRFSGTSVPSDFVEYPSQVNEMWQIWPSVLANYAVHYQTGEPIPAELVERLVESQLWGEGFRTTEYLAASLLDLAWHRLGPDDVPAPEEVEEFERAALERAGIAVDLVPPRYRTTYFSHIFASGYSAGYYSYIWSEVLDADTVEWFKQNGGLLRENGDRFRRELLSRGGSLDPMDAFRNFRGRDPELAPLLKRRGLG
ncbi:M3 family metallopeptidase [Flindersiella endophytica]